MMPDHSVLPFVVWPLVVVALGVFFLLLFRVPISRFIDRTKSVTKKGVRAYDNAQPTANKPDALAKFLESYHSPLLLEVESDIEQEIQDRGLTHPADVQKALVKSLAAAVVARHFEVVQSSIFASQLEALLFLNGLRGPMPKAHLKGRFYDKAATNFPAWYENRTFEQWFEFLKGHTLVFEAEAGVDISARGREFLKWRVEQRRSGPWSG